MKKEYLETLFEDVKEKFDLVIEGHQSLRSEIRDMRQEMNGRLELVDVKIDALDKKIDGVAADLGKRIDDVAVDLAAHRADTESHPKRFKVSE